MKTAILPNLTKENAQQATEAVIRQLRDIGAQVFMDRAMRDAFGTSGVSFCDDFTRMIDGCDIVIAVGGDGTIIHAAKHAASAGKPILGINAGRLGFVAGLEADELAQLKNLPGGNYRIEERMMLEASLKSDRYKTPHYALNDAVVSRGPRTKILDFKVSYNDQDICDYRADGLIVATPTGSTAYSLSAGGPVIDPSMQCIILTPICPHSLVTRPVVFGEASRLRIQTTSHYHDDIFLTLDGESFLKIPDGECIEFKKSRLSVQMVNLKQRTFYEVVNEKLSERRA